MLNKRDFFLSVAAVCGLGDCMHLFIMKIVSQGFTFKYNANFTSPTVLPLEVKTCLDQLHICCIIYQYHFKTL